MLSAKKAALWSHAASEDDTGDNLKKANVSNRWGLDVPMETRTDVTYLQRSPLARASFTQHLQEATVCCTLREARKGSSHNPTEEPFGYLRNLSMGGSLEEQFCNWDVCKDFISKFRKHPIFKLAYYHIMGFETLRASSMALFLTLLCALKHH